MKKLGLFLVACLLASRSFAAITATELLVKGSVQTYTLYTITGTMNGTTPVEVTISPTWITNGGSITVLVTSAGGNITASLRDSRFLVGDTTGFLASLQGTASASRVAITTELFEEVTKDARMSIAPGSYVLSLVSSASDTGTVSGTVLFNHVP
jgi:hypothetical protein